MRLFEWLTLVILIIALSAGILFLYLNLPPSDSFDFESYNQELTKNLSSTSNQFYPNMRYTDKTITYSIETNCSTVRKGEMKSAFERIAQQTILQFNELPQEGEIELYCSEIEPPSESESHYIAGEGGPVKILSINQYSLILSGKVSMYHDEKCPQPQVATHEILHALGFDHSSNSTSIMNPVTDCKQEIDQNIIQEINRIYSVSALPDLSIEKIKANKTGIYANIEVSVINNGLKDITNSSLVVSTHEGVAQIFYLDSFQVGEKKSLVITNLKLPKDTEEVTITVETENAELSKENNKITLRIVKAKQE